MQLITGEHYHLAGIIEQENLLIHFQPIVSIKKRSVIGLEALCRGVDPAGCNLCITVSSSFTDDKDDRYILCVDFKQ